MKARLQALIADFTAERFLTEREFLPAAIELIETPASPTLRITAALISLLFLIGLAWSYFGQVDIIATAPGKLIASSRTRVVQSFGTGVVRDIRVADGDTVKQGQVLIELDPTLPQADLTQYRDELTQARLDQARLHALLDTTPGGQKTDPFAGIQAPPDLVAAARARYAAESSEQAEKLGENDSNLAGKRADKAGVEAEIAKIDAALPLVQAREQIRASNLHIQFGNKIAYLQQAQELTEMQHERVAELRQRDAAAAAIAELTASRDQTVMEFRRGLLEDLAKADQQVTEATDGLTKADQQVQLATLTAPVAGTVQDLSVHTLGGIVSPAQQLLRIVPSQGGIEVEATISNQDVGFVDIGQEVEVKVATFPFTRYGVIHGHVVGLAGDSVQEPSNAPQDQGTQDASDTPNSIAHSSTLVFIARIALEKTTMAVEGKEIALLPGMAITAEIKTGRERVIDYLLSPFHRHLHDALRER